MYLSRNRVWDSLVTHMENFGTVEKATKFVWDPLQEALREGYGWCSGSFIMEEGAMKINWDLL